MALSGFQPTKLQVLVSKKLQIADSLNQKIYT